MSALTLMGRIFKTSDWISTALSIPESTIHLLLEEVRKRLSRRFGYHGLNLWQCSSNKVLCTVCALICKRRISKTPTMGLEIPESLLHFWLERMLRE